MITKNPSKFAKLKQHRCRFRKTPAFERKNVSLLNKDVEEDILQEIVLSAHATVAV